MKKGLLVNVFGTDCTAGGVTSGKTKAILIGDGIPEIFEPSEDAPALYLEVRSTSFGKGHLYLDHQGNTHKVIVSPNEVENRSGMFGGNFIHSSDSRFPFTAPIRVFDRFE